ncbi:MAG: hypothetical protein L6413_02940 [Coriobacteriia bacterium]|nr:hypothetical protein [Coriobacteriia bacterium]
MIISEEQVRLAVAYLQTSDSADRVHTERFHSGADNAALIEKVQAACATLPDTRSERVEHARTMVAGPQLSGSEVAEKMIGRIISDSLR